MSSANLEMVKKILDQLESERVTGVLEVKFSQGGVVYANLNRQLI